jgi:hypothetical protein
MTDHQDRHSDEVDPDYARGQRDLPEVDQPELDPTDPDYARGQRDNPLPHDGTQVDHVDIEDVETDPDEADSDFARGQRDLPVDEGDLDPDDESDFARGQRDLPPEDVRSV